MNSGYITINKTKQKQTNKQIPKQPFWPSTDEPYCLILYKLNLSNFAVTSPLNRKISYTCTGYYHCYIYYHYYSYIVLNAI